MSKKLFLVVLSLLGIDVFSQVTYGCLVELSKKSRDLEIKFVNEKAVSVRYTGMKERIPLKFDRNVGFARGGGEVYKEIYQGKVIGEYIVGFTMSAGDFVTYENFNTGKNYEFHYKDYGKKSPCFK